MVTPAARWVRTISADLDAPPETVGGKAHGLVVLHRIGLPVPAAFVVTTDACREFLRTGELPDGLAAEVAAGVAGLEAATGRRFGGSSAPLAVSVRSGAATSMPGMMSTVVNLGLTPAATAALAGEPGGARFADAARRGFSNSVAAAGTGEPLPDDPVEQLEWALRAVFSSWDAPRARTYRALHGIPDDLGTAVVVQAMVFGNRDDRSGSGVAFSRDPSTGERAPFGDVVFGGQGDDVVSGRSTPERLGELADREPGVWADLVDALDRVERHLRDACYVEFTYETGRLWLLQVRSGGYVGSAALRVAVDLADEHLIGRDEALLRITPHDLERARTRRVAVTGADVVLGRGTGASPGVVAGRVATTADSAVRLAADGPVVLVRPETSPSDVRGLAAAGGVVTARGGPASHAAVVARAMGKPAVVGTAGLVVDGSASVGGRVLDEGTVITIDGASGLVVLGRPAIVSGDVDAHRDRLLGWADDVSGDHSERDDAQRLGAAHAALRTVREQR